MHEKHMEICPVKRTQLTQKQLDVTTRPAKTRVLPTSRASRAGWNGAGGGRGKEPEAAGGACPPGAGGNNAGLEVTVLRAQIPPRPHRPTDRPTSPKPDGRGTAPPLPQITNKLGPPQGQKSRQKTMPSSGPASYGLQPSLLSTPGWRR